VRVSTLLYTIRVVDQAGNVGTNSVIRTYTIDTVAPTATANVTSYVDDLGLITGTFVTGTTTNDTTPTVWGTLSATLAAGEAVQVFKNGTFAGTASVSGVTWSFADTLGGEGSYYYTARVVDSAGNAGNMGTVGLTLTLDATAPVQSSTIWYVADDVSPKTGTLQTGGFTDDTTPTLAGTISSALGAGDIVQILRSGTVIGSASVIGTFWTFTDPGASAGTSYGYTARVVDAAGNTGPSSTALTITVDTTAPTQTITWNSATDDYGLATGVIASGGTTDDKTLTFSGTLSAALGAGDYVEVLRGGVSIGTASVSGVAWSFVDTSPADGTYG